MALSQTWSLQGTTATTIGATDSIAFSDGTFGNPIQVSSYNGGTHVRASGGTDSSAGKSPKNSKYLTSSTVDMGGGSVALSSVSTANCPIKIAIAESSNITVTDISVYAYDGTTTTTAPTGMNVQLAQQGNASWKQVHGSSNALALADSTTPATTHNFFMLLSASPTSVGVKSNNKLRIEFTYQ